MIKCSYKVKTEDEVCLFVAEKIRRSQGRSYHLTRVNRWSDCIGSRIEIVCQITTLSTILQHCTHTIKPSDPLLLANGTLRCRMYPAGKVAIS